MLVGSEQLRRALGPGGEADDAVRALCYEACDFAAEQMARTAPVVTGELRASIRAVTLRGRVGAYVVSRPSGGGLDGVLTAVGRAYVEANWPVIAARALRRRGRLL